MNKNEEYIVTIEDMGNDGEGIGHIDGMAIFVKDAALGDVAKVKIIKAKKNYCYGRLMEVITPSVFRVEPVCKNARRCGGCSLMHIDYNKQLEYKKNKVIGCMERIGGIENAKDLFEAIYPMETPYRYRNKMQFPIGLDRDGNVNIGFYAGRTHSIIDTDECAIGHPVNDFIIKNLKSWLNRQNKSQRNFIYDEESNDGLVRHILTRVGFKTGELMVCLVINGNNLRGLEEDFIKVIIESSDEYNKTIVEENNLTKVKITPASISLNINKDKTNKILGKKCVKIYGKETINDYIGDVCFDISPLSFYQVNPVQTKKLYKKALEYANLSGEEVVWDMYCGIGTISLFLAKKAKMVYGVEIIPEAIEDAKKNARLNNIKNTTFYVGKAEEVVAEVISHDKTSAKPDVVVVDPPRKGCDENLLRTLIVMNPKKIVYVSCDPATLARDTKYLVENGFKLEKFSAYDQFSHSTHVETVCLLSKVK